MMIPSIILRPGMVSVVLWVRLVVSDDLVLTGLLSNFCLILSSLLLLCFQFQLWEVSCVCSQCLWAEWLVSLSFGAVLIWFPKVLLWWVSELVLRVESLEQQFVCWKDDHSADSLLSKVNGIWIYCICYGYKKKYGFLYYVLDFLMMTGFDGL